MTGGANSLFWPPWDGTVPMCRMMQDSAEEPRELYVVHVVSLGVTGICTKPPAAGMSYIRVPVSGAPVYVSGTDSPAPLSSLDILL